MAKFTLIKANAVRNPHQGLVVKAYYKQEPDNPLEIPHTVVVFNCWPRVEIEADIIEYKLNGVYEYPSGKRTDVIRGIAPKTKEGTYFSGYNPEELIAKKLNVLTKVEV